MLSRVAERVYWMARYLERTENTTRLINVHTALLLDLPGQMEINWFTLIRLFNMEALFHQTNQQVSEESIMHFLMVSPENPSSLASSLASVRENVRTSLDILPEETWEEVNQAHILMSTNRANISSRQSRQKRLRLLLKHCQAVRGVIDSHLSRDYAYDFMQIGKHIERVDMTSRILEMAALLLHTDRSETLRKYEGILWSNLLQALNGRRMYQQHVSPRIHGGRVLEFLVKNDKFPCSLQHSLQEIGKYLQNLSDPEAALAKQQQLQTYIQQQHFDNIPHSQVHRVMDHIQTQLEPLHTEIMTTWFDPKRYEQQQSQTQSQSSF